MTNIFALLTVVGAFFAVVTGRGADVTGAILTSGGEAAQFVLTAGAAIVVYSGIMNIAERAGLTRALSRLLAPIIRRLFGELSEKTRSDITMNVSCNVLGLGNAATPYGLRAVREMSDGETANDRVILFTVINTSSLQLLPTTLAAVRQAAGSASPFDILPCVWICSCLSLITAVISCKICERWVKGRAKLHTSCTGGSNNYLRRGKKGKCV